MIIVLSKYILGQEKLPSKIFFVNSRIVYPIIGVVFIGNFLVILNFFFPLKSTFVIFSMLILLFPNLSVLKFNYSNILKIENIFYYFLIPSILIFSSFDIFYHYDAGYYHLNNQNWIRESNIIFGFVNIFWAFGMSSIYEYISSFLWFDESFILLHYLNIFFIHFFYIYLFRTIIYSKEKLLKNASIFLLIFSLLDNFGVSGGRNGFIYIESIGKQDNSVAILIYFLSITLFIYIRNKEIKKLDLILLPLVCLFVFQVKLSGVMVSFFYLFFIVLLIKNNSYQIKNILLYNIPAIIFSLIWVLKTYLQTGCFIFPVSFSCINNFNWYINGSTESFQEISTVSSYSISKFSTSAEWFKFFAETTYIRNVYINFLISFILLIIIKLIFFKKGSFSKEATYFSLIYIFLNVIYLIMFGPIPRYSTGLLITAVSFLGLKSGDIKINIKKPFYYLLIIFSIILIVRMDSYSFALNNNVPRYKNFNPRNATSYLSFNKDWVYPENGDQCWVNLKCTMAKSYINIEKNGIYKTASKK
tara:strand:- start:424 stop:2013 length:1590 start_codon:yes stop_codon:yes gene_type:complete